MPQIFANVEETNASTETEAMMKLPDVVKLLEQIANKLTPIPNQLPEELFDIKALIKDIRVAENQIDTVINKLKSGDYNT